MEEGKAMIDLDEIERRANAATPGPWRDKHQVCSEVWGQAPDSQTCSMQIARIGHAQFDALNAAFIAAARTDVPALIARVRELEAECERTRIFGSRKFAELRAADVEQMRGYGLSYEGVRKVLREHDDGEISFGKLMDLIRAAARAMAEDECAEMRVLLADAHRELATIEAITVSPSGVDGLMELVNRMGQKLEADK
jgi:hypothetical protein